MGLVGHVTMTLSGRSRSRARRSDDFAQTVGKNCDPTKGWGGVATEVWQRTTKATRRQKRFHNNAWVRETKNRRDTAAGSDVFW